MLNRLSVVDNVHTHMGLARPLEYFRQQLPMRQVIRWRGDIRIEKSRTLLKHDCSNASAAAL